MSVDDIQPLIVCGYVRSGTRMCANLLNNSREVELQGEILPSVAESTLAWLNAMKQHPRNKDPQTFYRFCRSTLRTVSKSNPLKREGVRWFGHKTPRHEKWFSEYELLFDHGDARARYVYCLRNPIHVWRSYRAMPWRSVPDVRQFLMDWVRSVEAYEDMKRTAPDRVILFNLDLMLTQTDVPAWLSKTIFEPLDIDSGTFSKAISEVHNTNSSQAKFGTPPSEPPESESDFLMRDRKLRRIIDEHFPSLRSHLPPTGLKRGWRLLRG